MEPVKGQRKHQCSCLEHTPVTVDQQETSGFPGAFSYYLKGGFTLTGTQFPQISSTEKIIL